MAPRNMAFWFLCQMLNNVRDSLPEEIFFYAAGKTDLCNERWDKNYEKWKAPRFNIGQSLASVDPSVQQKTLIFWLDSLLEDHHLHHCWEHVLDGGCLWEQLTTGCTNYMFSVLWALAMTVAAWLRNVCRNGQNRLVRVICVCNAGKHRSVYFSRMLHYIFLLVFQLLKLPSKHELHWIWAAEERVVSELEHVRQTNDMSNAKHRKRQPALVLAKVKAVFFSNQMVPHVVNMNLTDGLFTQCAKQPFQDHDQYVLDSVQFLRMARTTGVNPGVFGWIRDLFHDGCILPEIASNVVLRDHWMPFMQQLMQLFPQQCSLCCRWSMRQPWTAILTELECHEAEGQVFFLTAAELAQLRTAAGGVSFLTAAAPAESSSASRRGAGSVSFLTSAGAMPKRAPWADAVDAPPAPAEKRQKKVAFAATAPSEPEASPDTTAYFLILPCDMSQRVLWRHGGQEIDETQTADLLLGVHSKTRDFAMQQEEDSNGIASFTEQLWQDSDALRQELNALEASMAEVGSFPVVYFTGWCALRRLQFFVFLHMWSLLVQDYSFFVSSKFLRLAALPLQEAKGYDLLAVLHRYCYVIWLHRTEDPRRWSDPALRLLLPDSRAWLDWWTQQQLLAQDIAECAFCEEYALLVQNPLADPQGRQLREELDAMKRRVKLSDVPVPAELPPHFYWYEHDCYIDAADGLPTPRILPVFRCSAGGVEVDWGDNTGEPKNQTRDNIVVESHCCLEVKVPIPRTMTLNDVLGTRDWGQSFKQVRVARPYWLSSAACGFSARASAAACGFSARASDPATEVDTIPASSRSTQIHLQALGAELMATIRPDNVMHPHLRAHVEFMLGLFASVHLARADSDEVLLSDFLLGCGIRVEVADLSDVSWVADAYKQRHRDPVSVVRPMCHTMWGEKVRPIGCPVEEEGGSPRYFLVHDVCPLNKCEKHKEMLGFGTLCSNWHGFNKKHGLACTLAAQRWLQYGEIGEKGRATKDKKGSTQYFKTLLEELGFVAPAGTTAEDADDRVLTVGLPRWLPQFYSNVESRGLTLVPFNSQDHRNHFLETDRSACLRLRTHAVQLYDSMAKLSP